MLNVLELLLEFSSKNIRERLVGRLSKRREDNIRMDGRRWLRVMYVCIARVCRHQMEMSCHIRVPVALPQR